MEKVRYLITKKEITRLYVIKSLIEGRMTTRDAVEVLSVTQQNISPHKSQIIYTQKWVIICIMRQIKQSAP